MSLPQRSARALAGLSLRPGFLRPTIGIVVLVVVAIVSVELLMGKLPFVTTTGGGGGAVGPRITPTPSGVVVVPVDPRSKVPGEIVYVKDGNLWIQSGANVAQFTTTGNDAMPSFSADGAWIYFIQTHQASGQFACGGLSAGYALSVPAIMRIPANGSGSAQQLKSGAFSQGGSNWFYFLRQPVPNPAGTRLALVSDAPQPCGEDVVLQFLSLTTKQLSQVGVPESPPLGHQDPAWSPDGSSLLYVRNERDGARGAPVIYRYALASKTVTRVTGPGYLQPSFSPDGRYIAVTHLDTVGSDIVILDANNGHELARVTTDDASTAPVWSPAGDAIAYLHVTGGVADLEMVTLSGNAPNWTISDPIAMTQNAGLDPGSRPSWFIPAAQLPSPAPSQTSPAPSAASSAPAGSPLPATGSPSAPASGAP